MNSKNASGQVAVTIPKCLQFPHYLLHSPSRSNFFSSSHCTNSESLVPHLNISHPNSFSQPSSICPSTSCYHYPIHLPHLVIGIPHSFLKLVHCSLPHSYSHMHFRACTAHHCHLPFLCHSLPVLATCSVIGHYAMAICCSLPFPASGSQRLSFLSWSCRDSLTVVMTSYRLGAATSPQTHEPLISNQEALHASAHFLLAS